jgi:predicted DNA-binding transcriptional regulator YafY
MTGLSIEEAAKALSVKPRTVLRRLQKGALAGFKIDGQFGPEWRVTNFGPLTSPGQANTDLGLTTPDQPNTHDSAGDSSELVAELRQQITELKTELDRKVSEAQREIQAAAFRNGYLESQLETEREQVKLLTDRQHKTGRWRRFYSWFIGR